MKHTKSTLLIYTTVFLLLLTGSYCKSKKETAIVSNGSKLETFINPPVIIYKTRKDYSDKVPVGLSADKLSVVSYPDKGDIFYGGNFATPTLLAKGYLLDNRGIYLNSAFLKVTYEEYSRLAATPTAESLINLILDNDPFTEIYSCKCSRDTVELNRMIAEGLTKICKKIK
jgi:hypothetical protein